ncbi:MAG TPA: S8 family serine peptidase, partial [Phycisphaerae bacterium]|nr:S8 family serine peptidase [Phycisphaerae bacterium]
TVFTPLADQYVVCFTEEPAADAPGKLGLQGPDWKAIKGRGHEGMKVVRAPTGMKNVADSLKAVGKTRYLAPLYSLNGETVAIIPEIGVRLKNGHDRQAFDAFCQANGFTIIRRLEFTEQEYLLDPGAPDADGVFDAVEKLSTAPGVEWAEPNFGFQLRFHGPITPNDPYYPSQWHLNNTGQSGGIANADIDAPEAWEISTGSSNVIVAVLDQGVDIDHPDLIPNLVPGYDFYDDDTIPDPMGVDEGHGTACAGLIAAKGNNNIGVTGVAWHCKIMPIRICGPAGDAFVTNAEIADAFRWAAQQGAHIMSNSWGGGSPSSILYSAIKEVTAIGGMGRGGKGCVVFFSSGNENTGVVYPAKYPEVIAVGAVDKRNQRCSYSNYGSELDLVAPSGYGDLWTTDVLGQAGYNNSNTSILDYTDKMDGTSGACPIAAGVAALVLSVSPQLNRTEVQDLLQSTAQDLGATGRDNYYGYGRVNAYAALSGQAGRFIIVQTPNGGEAFEAGTIVTINWTARGGSWVATDTVRIEYSSNNGAVWTPIPGAMSISYAARTFDWITGGMLPSDRYLIRITALADTSATDRSDAAFTITGPLHHFDFVMDPWQTNTWPIQGVCKVTAKDSAGLTITTFETANTAGRFPVTISAPGVTVTGLPGPGGCRLPATCFVKGVADLVALGMKIATATPPVTVPFTATSADGKSGTSGDVAITPIGPPGPPMLPNPADAATGVPVDTNLSWVPAISIAVETYDVYFAGNNPPATLIYKDLPALTCDPTKIAGQSLDYSTTYYWKVIARNPEGETEGPVWSFTTGPPDVLHHFKWDPIPSPQQTGVRFPVTITAQDAANNLVSTFDGKVAIT